MNIRVSLQSIHYKKGAVTKTGERKLKIKAFFKYYKHNAGRKFGTVTIKRCIYICFRDIALATHGTTFKKYITKYFFRNSVGSKRNAVTISIIFLKGSTEGTSIAF